MDAVLEVLEARGVEYPAEMAPDEVDDSNYPERRGRQEGPRAFEVAQAGTERRDAHRQGRQERRREESTQAAPVALSREAGLSQGAAPNQGVVPSPEEASGRVGAGRDPVALEKEEAPEERRLRLPQRPPRPRWKGRRAAWNRRELEGRSRAGEMPAPVKRVSVRRRQWQRQLASARVWV